MVSIHHWVHEASTLNRLTAKSRVRTSLCYRIENEIRKGFLDKIEEYGDYPKERAFIEKAVLNSELTRMAREK